MSNDKNKSTPEILNQYWENIRHLENERMHFITFYVSFIVVIEMYVLTIQNTPFNIYHVILIWIFSLFGIIVTIQIHYQSKIYRDEIKDIEIHKGIFDKFDNQNVLLRYTRIWQITILFFVSNIAIMTIVYWKLHF